jgi:hypothetical protein
MSKPIVNHYWQILFRFLFLLLTFKIEVSYKMSMQDSSMSCLPGAAPAPNGLHPFFTEHEIPLLKKPSWTTFVLVPWTCFGRAASSNNGSRT